MKRTLREPKLRRRSLVLVVFMTGWMLVVMGRLTCLQVVQHETMLARAQGQHRRTIRISPLRGVIYDRLGRELARSAEAESVYAVPAEAAPAKAQAHRLAQALGLKAQDILEKLTGTREFVWVKRKVSPTEAAAVRTLQLPGIHFVSENKRQYPNGQLAAHLIGYVGIDEVGLDGVELTYDAHLRGQEGYILVQRDARGRLYGRTQPPIYKGQDLTLTIDAAIQMEVEAALHEAVEQAKARSGIAIVMVPKTGEILALANVPTFDPNQFTSTSENQRRNRAVRDLYEPGSVFKIVTYAAALEEGQVKPDDDIDCLGGKITLARQTIRDHKVFHTLSVREALENSSNVGAIRLALAVGQEPFVEYMKSFGFCRSTDIDLSGETAGLMPPVEKWSKGSLGAAAIGQGIGVTAIQMAAAMSMIANGGIWIQPHVVRSVHARSGDVLTETSPVLRQVISQKTAATLAQMLEGVVLRGTGKRAQLSGYTAAGKTGTAQQFDPQTGRYSATRYVASFAGFAPVKNPQVCILVAIDDPRGDYHGGGVAAPVFRRIAEMALHYLKVTPDAVNTGIELVALDDGFTSEETGGVVTGAGENGDAGAWESASMGEWESGKPIDHQRPMTANPLVVSSEVIPSFEGQGIRLVAEQCARLGLRLIAIGSGRAVDQYPEPGTAITPGLTCRVEFER